MSEEHRDPGKLIAIGTALVIATALVTGVVVANWKDKETQGRESVLSKGTARQADPVTPGAESPREPVRQAAATPSPSDIEACNRYAKSATASTPTDVIEKAAIGAAIGAGVGAAGGAIAGGGKGAGKGAGIGGIVGAAAGTLYGLNEANQKDARAVDAYRACMRERGYSN
jgi:hypothetical protein